MLTKSICVIKKCGRQFVSRINSPYCPLCRHNIYGWAKRKPEDILRYVDVLAQRSDRLSQVATNGKRNNIVPFRKVRRG